MTIKAANSASTAPNDIREARARDALHQQDPRLDIRWIWTAVHEDDVNNEIIHWEGRYSLIYRLHQDDPLRLLQTAAGADEAWETLGWFTEDMNRCETPMIPCDEMEPKMVKFLGEIDGTQQDVSDRLANVIRSNEDMTSSKERDYVDEAVERAKENRRIHMDIPFVGAYTTRRG